MARQPIFTSKLPHTENSIFSEMTALAQKHHAVNLSQGFPDYEVDPDLIDFVHTAMMNGHNQYAPMAGVFALRERIAQKYRDFYQVEVDPENEITITAGGTQALFTAIAALIGPGDEAIIFEPAYDSYRPAVEAFGGKVIPVNLYAPDFKIDWNEVHNLINPRTKLIIINNPGNPSCTVWEHEDLLQLDQLTQDTDIFVLSDEVYEHLIFDGRTHHSVALFPQLRQRSFAVASFGKLLHSTGWKIGYVIAPPLLTFEFRKIHQFNVFSVNTPIQYAITEYLDKENYYTELSLFFQRKRDFVLEGLKDSRFQVQPSQGTYFLLLNYEGISSKTEMDFSVELTQQHGVALIPMSAFYSRDIQQKTLRLCFAKKEDTLLKAIDILNRIS